MQRIPGPFRFPLLALLALAAAPAGAAGLQVSPRCRVVQAGQTVAFRARLAGADPGPCRWTLAPDPGACTAGILDAAQGIFIASYPEDVAALCVQVCLERDPECRGGAQVVVLPHQPFQVVEQVLGPDWAEAWSRDLPFLDLATGRRFAPGAEVRVQDHARGPRPFPTLGSGLPYRLTWTPLPGEAQLLSCQEADQVVRRDVTGQDAADLRLWHQPAGPIQLESLERLDGAANRWWSHVRQLRVGVRGLMALAGNPVPVAPDGPAGPPRMREPFGLARVTRNPAVQGFLVADAENHCLWLVSPGGQAAVFCGRPLEPGHQDGADSRFCRPTYLDVRHWMSSSSPSDGCLYDWEAVLADTGNHVLRRVDSSGRAGTLAGAPGQAGHLDGPDPGAALLHTPKGVVVAGDGTVYVADSGNSVIRRIEPGAGVTTLAGRPGIRGGQDGPPGVGTFTDLKGLAANAHGLYVTDGHSLRQVSYDGEITTLAGAPDAPGFAAEWDRAGLAGVPCLRDPGGLCLGPDSVFVADTGNHAVREFSLPQGTLRTLAGDPGWPQVRWGLLRDGIWGGVDPRYGALRAPRDVALDLIGASLAVSTSTCLAQLRDFHPRRDDSLYFEPITLPDLEADRDTPFTATFRPPRGLFQDPLGPPRTVRYEVFFLEADPAEPEPPISGLALEGAPLSFATSFSRPGRARVVFRWVTAQGVSGCEWRWVTVRPGSGAPLHPGPAGARRRGHHEEPPGPVGPQGDGPGDRALGHDGRDDPVADQVPVPGHDAAEGERVGAGEVEAQDGHLGPRRAAAGVEIQDPDDVEIRRKRQRGLGRQAGGEGGRKEG